MFYLLIGDDILYKNNFIKDLKQEFINYIDKIYYIENNNDMNVSLDECKLFLNTTSFFDEKKIVKINCNQETFIEKIIDELLIFCDCNNIVILSISNLKQSMLNKISKNINISIHKFNNFKNKLDANKYILNVLKENNIIFETKNDMELLCNIILKNSKIPNSNTFDKQMIQLDLDKLIDTHIFFNKPIRFTDIEKLYCYKFDGNFFNLVDQIFIKNSLYDIIKCFEDHCSSFNIEETSSFLNIMRYTIKEYIKFINKKETKKAYIFKKSSTTIINPEILLYELGEISINYRLSKKLNLEKINLLIIKHIKIT